MNRHLWLASALVALTLTGCMVRAQPVVGVSATVTSDEYEPVYPAAPPPAPVAEYRSPPPGYGYLWVDGYWDWSGYDWTWSQGYWAPERVGFIYVRPRYVFDNGRWSYHRSYWNGPEGRRDYDWGRPGGRGTAPAVRGAPTPAPYYGNQVRGAAPPAAAPPPRWGAPASPAAPASPPQRWGAPASPPAPAAPPPPRWGAPASPAAPASPPPRWAAPASPAAPAAASPPRWGAPASPAAPASPPPRWGAPASPPAQPGNTPARPGWTAPSTPTPPPNAAQTPRIWNGRGPDAPSPAPAAPPPRSGFSPGPSSTMGSHFGPVRPQAAPSTAVPSGTRPAPAPVQGGNAVKRGKSTGR